MYRSKVSSKEQLDVAQGKVRPYHRRCKEAELMEVCKCRERGRRERERERERGNTILEYKSSCGRLGALP